MKLAFNEGQKLFVRYILVDIIRSAKIGKNKQVVKEGQYVLNKFRGESLYVDLKPKHVNLVYDICTNFLNEIDHSDVPEQMNEVVGFAQEALKLIETKIGELNGKTIQEEV